MTFTTSACRLLVPGGLLDAARVTLPKDAAHHLAVVRPKPGETVELFDGAGHTRRYAYAAGVLEARGEKETAAKPDVGLTLFACVTKGSRWDWTVEKAVELGVTRIVPVISDRCIVRLDARERAAKAARWRRVAEDAARQSGAVWLPEVEAPVDFAAALGLVREQTRVFVGALTDPEPAPLLRELAGIERTAGASYGVFVGPEGDFTPAELTELLTCAVPVSFGPTVLRAETAAIFALSVLAARLHAR